MYRVELKYSKGRHHPVKVVGASSIIQANWASWHRETFGYRWIRMMIWNRAALRMEGGVNTKSDKVAYEYRMPGKREVITVR